MDIVSFNWARDLAGYEIVERSKRPDSTMITDLTDRGGIYVVRRGGPMEPYEPLKIDGLYRRLADCDKTPEDALYFIKTFGYPDFKDNDEYPVISFYGIVDNMRQGVALADQGEWGILADAFEGAIIKRYGVGNVSFVFHHREGDERPTVAFRPRSLMAAMWLQFALDCSGGGKLRKCKWCPQYFKYGSGTGRRKTAEYCSPKCQKAHTYARREEATQ